MRITEYMYSGSNGEFIEFTNVGATAIDMTGWSYDDDSALAGSFDLGAFGTVAPGASVVLTETLEATFRSAWNLGADVRIIGGLSVNLGRADAIHLFDAAGTLVDRLGYGDEAFADTIRTQNISGWISAAGLGVDNPAEWTLSVVADGEASIASSGGDIGSPGRSTRAASPGLMRISEWMYDSAGGEFIELTNVGGLPISLVGWRYDDDSANPSIGFDLSGFGTVQPGESVVLSEFEAEAFLDDWNLCSNVKILGGYTNNLGRADQINVFDADGVLVDRLTYGDVTFPGSIRTSGASGWVSAAGLGVNNVFEWTLSSVGDAEASVASSQGAIGSPGRSTRALIAYDGCGLGGRMRITEYMYSGADGEFIEFTNVGDAPVSLLGWSFSESAAQPGKQDLSGFAFVQPGESVILTESSASAFRNAWKLCSGVRIVGGLTQNLGRADEINLYDNRDDLADQLTYGDQTFPGTIRTQDFSGWVSAAGLGENDIAAWTLSALADGEGSVTSLGGDIGSPGRSTRAPFPYDACVGIAGGPRITIDLPLVAPYLDLEVNSGGALSGVIADPTDPAATRGITLRFSDEDGAVDDLQIELVSSNPQLVPTSAMLLTGSGDSRRLRIFPQGVGFTTILVVATDADGKVGTYVFNYAASAPSVNAATTRFHTGASDASTALAVDAEAMLVADDENQAVRLYDRDQSGLPAAVFDFTAQLALTDLDDGFPREVDIEGSTRIGNRLYWTGSQGNARGGEARPNTRRIFATDLEGNGSTATLTYAGRYDHLRDDLLAWDTANGHGLGADYLGFVAGAQPGVLPTTATGFNIEGLSIAPDGRSAYLAFRAPLMPPDQRNRALVIPLRNLDALVTGGAPGSLAAGSTQFGAPIFLDLGGRSIRSIERNAAGQYLIIAGPAGGDAGAAPNDFRVFQWSGASGQPAIDLGSELGKRLAGGSFEGIVDVPDLAAQGMTIQLLVDNGDFAFYNDGVAAKDIEEKRWTKFRTEFVTIDAELLFGDGFD
ncbi:MAG: lamin tail domain-containing protein [Dokdonella sp.]